jgi:hypothetical protein
MSSFRSQLDRERTDRPSYSGTDFEDDFELERSLGDEAQAKKKNSDQPKTERGTER